MVTGGCVVVVVVVTRGAVVVVVVGTVWAEAAAAAAAASGVSACSRVNGVGMGKSLSRIGIPQCTETEGPPHRRELAVRRAGTVVDSDEVTGMALPICRITLAGEDVGERGLDRRARRGRGEPMRVRQHAKREVDDPLPGDPDGKWLEQELS